jgi:hypothetical protein
MQRRKFLAGLGTLAAGSAAAVGTGAFTSVEADRNISVQTQGDSGAFLAFETGSATNSAYASGADTGTVSIDLNSDADVDGVGVNKQGTTQINDIFKIRNQGTQAVVVYADPSSITQAERTTSSGFGIDPQADNRPNGDYTKTGTVAEGVSSDQISLTGVYSNPPYEYTAYINDGTVADAVEEFVLEPGEAFDFGLYVNGGSGGSINSDITIIADSALVPDNYAGEDS